MTTSEMSTLEKHVSYVDRLLLTDVGIRTAKST